MKIFDEDIMDINYSSNDKEDHSKISENDINGFNERLDKAAALYRARGEEPDWVSILKWSIFWHALPDTFHNITLVLIAELCSLSYAFFIGNMINFLTDPKVNR